MRILIFFLVMIFGFCQTAFADPVSIVTLVAGIAVAAAEVGPIVSLLIVAAASFTASLIFTKQPKVGSISADYAGLLDNQAGGITTHRIIYGTRRVGGQVFFRDTTNSGLDNLGNTSSGTNKFLHVCIAFAGHECEEISKVFFDDTEVNLDENGWATNDRYIKTVTIPSEEVGGEDTEADKSFVRVKKHLGASDQTADSDLVNEHPNWTVDHRARGICYAYVRLEYDANIFDRIPKITAEIKGKKIYDPRTEETVFSNNAALCIRDYIVSEYGLNASNDEVDDTFFSAAANTCEEQVELADGTFQDRYTCDTVLERDQQVIDNLSQLTSAIAGVVTYSQGKFRCHVGEYEIPTITVTDSWLAGDIQVVPRANRKDLFNAVKGVFIDEENNYQPTDFPMVTNSTYETQDGGERIAKDIQLSCTTNVQRAQRMAKIILEKHRQAITINFPMNFSALELSVYDNFMYSNADLGWTNKVFKVQKWEFAENGQGINITAKEEASNQYDWNAGEATLIDAAPDTGLSSPFDIDPPGSPQVSESLYETSGSAGLKIKADISWEPSPSSYVISYQMQYKLTSSSTWNNYGATENTTVTIYDIPTGTYDFRVRARSSIGSYSNWVQNTREIFGLVAPPSDITNFSLNVIHDNAHLSWDAISDLDVKLGGKIIIKHAGDPENYSWSTAIQIIPAQSGTSTQVVAPLLDGVYLIKAEDSSGIQSTNEAIILSTVANLVKLNVIETKIEDTEFNGDKTNVVAIDDILKLESRLTIDDIEDPIDSWVGLFDSLNGTGFVSSASYVFDGYTDIGKVATCRLTADILAPVDSEVDTIDSRVNNIDTWPSFDGGPFDSISIKLFVRTTNDDPSDDPTWSDWRTFFVGDYTARAFQFKMEITNTDQTVNVYVSRLRVKIDMPDITDSGQTTTLTLSDKTVNFNQNFVIDEPIVNGTIVGASTGDYLDFSNVTATSFDVSVKNSSGSKIAKTINWIAKGY